MPDPKPSPSPRGGLRRALPLIALAGATDALVFQHSKQLLAVYMTGNTTRVGEFALQGRWQSTAPLLAVLGVFLLATTGAAWLGQRVGDWRATLVMTLSAVLMACAAPLAALQPESFSLATVALIAAAIGCLNQALAGEPGVSFITGVLVKTGRALAAARWAEAAGDLLRWLALLLGAVAGCVLTSIFGTATLLVIASLIIVNALCAWPQQVAVVV
ncbi:YoaK family protein [Pseudomonas sp. HR96]|uniref:YoaK family protein n=1 Tax=Pseudomonas sp. HR96 TaxID=1027966 RepID=UPI002A74AE9E|nr:YoaK family protein [Pseudomonas sp. HR96]WPO98188.1 YoaK family protein [Pseudomonas sp. HR96]